MKIESMEFIPMNKDSIFDAETFIEKETVGITTDSNIWLEKIKEINNPNNIHFNGFNECYFIDIGTIKYLVRNYKFAGYMFGPTALINGVPITTKTRIVKNLEDFDNLNNELNNEINDMYLYNLIYYPSIWRHTIVDKATFEPKTLIKPQLTDAYWMIKFATLEE